MTYEPLALKYRPRSFDDMVGQEHVTAGLRAAIDGGRVAHAYLFSGPRGTGKTTTARILARCLNCEVGVTADPCGQCPTCRAVLDGASLDVLELDAASQRTVDDTEGWISSVHLVPAGRNKVYIVDEVHMLSKTSFNMLLKTFEEPPEHVVFVLATTEPEKVPATVRGRCQRFDFRLVPHEVLVSRYQFICDSEGLAPQPGALELIARQAAGSVRDGITLLEQAIADDGVTVELSRVRALTGAVDRQLVERAVDLMIEGDAGGVFPLVAEVATAGADLRRYAEDLVAYLRGVMVSSAGADPRRLLDDIDESAAASMMRQGDALGASGAIARLERAAKAAKDVDNEPLGRITLEAALVRCCLEGRQPAVAPVHETKPAVEPVGPIDPVEPVEPKAPTAAEAPAAAPAPAATTRAAGPGDAVSASRQWRDVELQVGAVAKTLLEGSHVVAVEGSLLRVGVDAEFKVRRLNDKKAEIESVASRVFAPGTRVAFEVSGAGPEIASDDDPFDVDDVSEEAPAATISVVEMVKQGFAAEVVEEYGSE